MKHRDATIRLLGHVREREITNLLDRYRHVHFYGHLRLSLIALNELLARRHHRLLVAAINICIDPVLLF